MAATIASFGTRHDALNIGIDIGSTTAKAVVCSKGSRTVLYSTYRRHFAHQVDAFKNILIDIEKQFGDRPYRMSISGSGGKTIADKLGLPYIQEVVANSIAVQKLYPQARCAIELGGQDAKMIFFSHDEKTGHLTISDMRMNGSCAGGTGAFIDEIASLLETPVEQLDELARKAKSSYSISGRCGVYAKTDIQPLLNQGAAKEDLIRSTFYAVAKQTLGGLAQGLDINPPIVFVGGPLTFNPELVSVFAEQLNLAEKDVIVPEHAETIVALGSAYALDSTFSHTQADVSPVSLIESLDEQFEDGISSATANPPLFKTQAELEAFRLRHASGSYPASTPGRRGETLRAYLGIDSGSTTTKFVLIDESEQLVDYFYANNEGDPLDVAKTALAKLNQRYEHAGVNLEIIACGTTGYGEQLFASAFKADYHTVETVAHARAAASCDPQTSFVLDIGGQDMKAIWLHDGIVTDIMVNEACSSGCGSFLEEFAKSLHIPTEHIADAAFASRNPADLGSRCTVFMNSSVVTEQRNGKSPQDIMAGLCRSIVENVFTKVIRISNLDSLGDCIAVQGGTFANDAVLAAFEQYLGKPVKRAPYPGLMGAIGIALLTKQYVTEKRAESAAAFSSSFIGLNKAQHMQYSRQSDVVCPFCANACRRTIVSFSDGGQWVSGNRCERGSIVGDVTAPETKEKLRRINNTLNRTPNLFEERNRLLFAEYPYKQLAPSRNETIGLPRVLAIWENAPFWTTLFRSLGFKVLLSHPSTREMYESGLPAIASDTVCFPAKLVHGHIRDLARQGVDRIFMPTVTTVPSENRHATSVSMCAVVKGYSIVIRNSDNPSKKFDVSFENPLFHWYSNEDRDKQLTAYFERTFSIPKSLTLQSIRIADTAQESFRSKLLEIGAKTLEAARKKKSYALVLASRPYHNDPLVNHDLPKMFAELGIPVLTADSVPGIDETDLSHSRLDIVNNYHARMLSSAVASALDDSLEYAQIVSFGCGHDAYLSDEITRVHHELSNKTPLVLKLDESDATGPLRIRVRSFIETIDMRRKARCELVDADRSHRLPDPYPVKFEKADRAQRVVLVPNTSHAFSRLMASVFSKQGLRAVPLQIGTDRAIELGKQYVHNDICFPAQIVIGEALAELERGKYDHAHVAVATGKYIGDCRLTHYAALLRRALDDAGYADVPIITNDDVDYHDMHPGFKMNALSAYRVAFTLPMIDILEEMLRKIRPYEKNPGDADRAFEKALDEVIAGLDAHGSRGVKSGFKRALSIMDAVEYDRSKPRPRVLIVGEYLLNFHPGANHEIERYLEENGLEVIEARMTDVIQKSYYYKDMQVKRFGVSLRRSEKTWNSLANAIFAHAHDVADKIASQSPLYERPARIDELANLSDPIIDRSFDAGEGILIPAEILHHAARGCRNFLILQPFGCLPNHIVGRGISKKLKELYPEAQILPLDYDPDVSFANLENRLQMLVMNALNSERGAHDNDQDNQQNCGQDYVKSRQIIELNRLVDASLDIAACATAIASIAHDLSMIANETIFLAESNNQVTISWIAERRDYVFANTKSLAAKAEALTRHADAIAESVSSLSLETSEQRVLRVQNTAYECKKLANQLNAGMSVVLHEMSSNYEVLQIRVQDREPTQTVEILRSEVLRFAQSVAARMKNLDKNARALSSRVSANISGEPSTETS